MKNHHATAAWIVILCLAYAPSAFALLPTDAPPLPMPDPLVYTIIEVSTAQELVDAAWGLQNAHAIILAPGVYDLSTVASPTGQKSVMFGTQSGPLLDDIQIRGQSGNPADVQIIGAGMLDAAVLSGIHILGASNVLIADLTVSQVYYHAVEVTGSFGAADIHLYNCAFLDSGLQLVKINSGNGSTPSGMRLSYCTLRYTAGTPVHPEAGVVQGGGVAGLTTIDMQISDCLFDGIHAADGSLGKPAVEVYWDAAGTTVERCTFLNSTRGVALGHPSFPHDGGVVRNNFFRTDPLALTDAQIYCASPGTLILHNSILTHGDTNGIEVRFATTTNVDVRHNLMDSTVSIRDGATPSVADNITNALPGWFVDEASGNLHLVDNSSPAVDQVSVLAGATDDFDANMRPTDANQADIGAAEYVDPATAAPATQLTRHVLYPSSPNPFNPRTTIRYILAAADEVTLQVYDARGRRVRSLLAGWQSQGEHELTWNGRDDAGREVASGVYSYRLAGNPPSAVRRMVLLR